MGAASAFFLETQVFGESLMSVSVCTRDGCNLAEAISSLRGAWNRYCKRWLRERKMRLITEKGYQDEDEALSVTRGNLLRLASSIADACAADPAVSRSTTAPVGLGRSLAHVAPRVGLWIDVRLVHRVHDCYLRGSFPSLSPIRLLRIPPLGTPAHDGPKAVGRPLRG